ncbi:MAG: hypothetical protein Q9163_004743 [Psora crenata]
MSAASPTGGGYFALNARWFGFNNLLFHNVKNGLILTPHPLFRDPPRPQDLYNITQTFQKSSSLSRKQRVALGRAGKAIRRTNTRNTELVTRVSSLESKLERFQNKSRPKKKVQWDPNTRFAEVESIRKAKQEVAVQERINESKRAQFEARIASQAHMNLSLESMQFEWQS